MIVRILSVLLVLMLTVSGVSAGTEPNVCYAPAPSQMNRSAQTETCLTPDAMTSARDVCASLAAGQVCLGAGEVEGGGLIAVGTVAELANVDSLVGSSGAITLLAMQADLPASEAPVRLVLFGDASIADAYEGAQPPFPTVTVKNGPINILNLRATPSESGEVAGTMGWSEELVADGRSSDGLWYRVQDGGVTAWVFASLVTLGEGDDASTLVALDSPITQPMQSLTLETNEACGGLLVQANSDSLAHLEVNGALLTFSRAALLLRGAEDGGLSVQVVNGSAEVQANGESALAETGSQVTVTQDAAPQVVERYAFSSVTSAPLDLLPAESLTCVAGVVGAAAALYSAPGGDAAGELSAESNATITGQHTAEDGTLWWLVNNEAWAAAGDDVQTAGVCEAIPEVSATAAQQQVSQPVSQSSNFDASQVPPGRSIWIANTGPDNLSGVCTAPPIAQCDHLAAVTVQANGTITWLGQEPQPYTLFPSGDNTFSYSGRNQLNNANLSLTVTFTSQAAWVGTMNIVYDADSGCTHTFNYTAVLR